MKIERFSGPKSAATRRSGQSASAGGGGFARALDDGPSQSAAPAGPGPVHPLTALLALQEVGAPTGGRRRSRKRAEDLLDPREELRLAIALCHVPLGPPTALARCF